MIVGSGKLSQVRSALNRWIEFHESPVASGLHREALSISGQFSVAEVWAV